MLTNHIKYAMVNQPYFGKNKIDKSRHRQVYKISVFYSYIFYKILVIYILIKLILYFRLIYSLITLIILIYFPSYFYTQFSQAVILSFITFIYIIYLILEHPHLLFIQTFLLLFYLIKSFNRLFPIQKTYTNLQNIIFYYQVIQQMNIQASSQQASILCPNCGIKFNPTIGNICMTCTITKTDITMGITKQSVLNYCRFCHRYLRPPWVFCQRESRQLLAICLKKIKGLNKVKLLNAAFIWTQPHSKRIKVKVTVSKQINALSNIQQTFIVQFIEAYTQCEDCKKQFTPHTWGAIVQVRQHASHKKTFYFIEQLILKHNAHQKVLKVEEQQDGINFYYKNTTHAQRLIDFLGNLLPTVVKTSKQLVSHDESSNTFVYKYGFSVELPKICKQDLVIIPKKLAIALGGCSQLLLCLKVTHVIHLIDLATYKTVQMNSLQYFHYERDIQLLPFSTYKSEFIVLDSTPNDKKFNINNSTTTLNNKLYNIVLTRKQQWQNLQVKCHLGDLPCGQIVQGFDLRFLSYSEDINNYKGVPQVIIVKRQKDPNKKRGFKLKRLQNQGVIIEQGFKKKKKGQQQNKDYEQFLDDVATDKQLRKNVKVYADQKVLKNLKQQQAKDLLGDIQLLELLQDLKIDESQQNLYSNDLEGVEQLIQKMQKVNLVEK